MMPSGSTCTRTTRTHTTRDRPWRLDHGRIAHDHVRVLCRKGGEPFCEHQHIFPSLLNQRRRRWYRDTFVIVVHDETESLLSHTISISVQISSTIGAEIFVRKVQGSHDVTRLELLSRAEVKNKKRPSVRRRCRSLFFLRVLASRAADFALSILLVGVFAVIVVSCRLRQNRGELATFNSFEYLALTIDVLSHGCHSSEARSFVRTRLRGFVAARTKERTYR